MAPGSLYDGLEDADEFETPDALEDWGYPAGIERLNNLNPQVRREAIAELMQTAQGWNDYWDQCHTDGTEAFAKALLECGLYFQRERSDQFPQLLEGLQQDEGEVRVAASAVLAAMPFDSSLMNEAIPVIQQALVDPYQPVRIHICQAVGRHLLYTQDEYNTVYKELLPLVEPLRENIQDSTPELYEAASFALEQVFSNLAKSDDSMHIVSELLKILARLDDEHASIARAIAAGSITHVQCQDDSDTRVCQLILDAMSNQDDVSVYLTDELGAPDERIPLMAACVLAWLSNQKH